jgi:hypothetical protein
LAISRKIILEDEMELLALEIPKAHETSEAPLLNEKELNDIFADSSMIQVLKRISIKKKLGYK